MQAASSALQRFLKLPFSKKRLSRRKYHEFVLCKYDSGVALSELLRYWKLTWEYTPSEQKPNSHVVLTRAAPIVRDIAAALAKLIQLIHELGYSLDGVLRLNMLYWIPHTKSIKIRGLRKDELKQRTDDMAVEDYYSVYRIFVHEIFFDSKAPRELMEWLYYLQRNPLFYEQLIRGHMFLLDDETKVGQYCILYQKLQQVKSMNTQIYLKALSFVCAGNCEMLTQWQVEVIQSDLLEAVKNHQDASGRVKVFTRDEEGLTIFGRHTCSHVLDRSVLRLGNGHYVIRIKLSEVFAHIDSFTPGLFEQLQKAMFIISQDLAAANLPEL